MKAGPDIAYVAALIGDPARANMLTALMRGKALTVSELSAEAGVTMQTASSHLSKLESSGLLRMRKQGRHKYFALASDDVAHVLEGLMGLAAGTGRLRTRPGPKDGALRRARVCYNHLAGEMGTKMFDSLTARGRLALEGEDVRLTVSGEAFVEEFGISLRDLRTSRSPYAGFVWIGANGDPICQAAWAARFWIGSKRSPGRGAIRTAAWFTSRPRASVTSPVFSPSTRRDHAANAFRSSFPRWPASGPPYPP